MAYRHVLESLLAWASDAAKGSDNGVRGAHCYMS
jgi:hypothetical protein